MSSYKIIDHEYDVIVLGAGGSGLRAAVGLSEAGLKDSMYFKSFSNKKSYFCGTRRYIGILRKYG